jgi:hypothetical protein
MRSANTQLKTAHRLFSSELGHGSVIPHPVACSQDTSSLIFNSAYNLSGQIVTRGTVMLMISPGPMRRSSISKQWLPSKPAVDTFL